MAIDKTLIDQLLADYKEPEDIIGENGLLKELTKAILERALFLQKGTVLEPSRLLAKQPVAAKPVPQAPSQAEVKSLAQVEQEFIQCTLSALSGNLTQTAKALGISISTLKRKLKEYGLKAR